jgi:hypothetical protein
MTTLVLVICVAAIFCFFSQEFTRAFKKIFAIKGATLILPLAIASWFVFTFDYLVLWALLYIREVLDNMNQFLIRVLPEKKYSSDIILIVLLTLTSVGPVIILNILSYRKTHKPYPYPYLLSTILWIIGAILLVSLPALYSQTFLN